MLPIRKRASASETTKHADSSVSSAMSTPYRCVRLMGNPVTFKFGSSVDGLRATAAACASPSGVLGRGASGRGGSTCTGAGAAAVGFAALDSLLPMLRYAVGVSGHSSAAGGHTPLRGQHRVHYWCCQHSKSPHQRTGSHHHHHHAGQSACVYSRLRLCDASTQPCPPQSTSPRAAAVYMKQTNGREGQQRKRHEQQPTAPNVCHNTTINGTTCTGKRTYSQNTAESDAHEGDGAHLRAAARPVATM